ncbi:MAG TPA: CRTAC1 family protein [Bryobacteraceae bacterium]|nr:CRTAC1 family protein [Bryobacteraceae bacterium]
MTRKIRRREFMRYGLAGFAARGSLGQPSQRFEPVQPELFGAPGGQPNCWADFDNDGDLDLFVGFKADLPNRLYRNDGGRFVEVAADHRINDLPDTRAAAWGDFDADGNHDLYVGFTRKSGVANKLYHNQGHGKFVDVAKDLGVDVKGETRQVTWVDFDNDGRVDLFVAFRDAPNMLFHNEGHRFVDVARDMGVDDPRKTVGAVWFDYNGDGRLDVFTANQDGTLNGFYRNDGNRFVDVAHELGMDAFGRPPANGSNGPSVADYDNDGHLDLFVAGYGANFLFHNDGRGNFSNVADPMGLNPGEKATPSSWGDYDNDGRVDLAVSSYVDKPLNEKNYLYHNDGNQFGNAIPPQIARHGPTHGLVWADFDGDGALDLAITNNNPEGTHYVFRNVMPPELARRSVQVMVLDHQGRYTRAGSEVRIYAPGTREVWGGRIVDTCGGYCSQSIAPVHFGLPKHSRVDVEITSFTKKGRRVTKVANVDPDQLPRRVLTVKLPKP